MILHTPVNLFRINETSVLVKREDLCCPPPGPPFSKMRGVYAHVKNRPEDVIGVLDTYHSQGGWAVSYAGNLLGRRVINYWPQYMNNPGGKLQPQQCAAKDLGATLVSLKAGRSAILYHRAKAHLQVNYPGAYMMPNALKLTESVTENAEELKYTYLQLPVDSHFVISISSGTVAAGVIQGLEQLGKSHRVDLHLGYSRTESAVKNYLRKMIGPIQHTGLRIVDEKYQYADAVDNSSIPFPCNRYYDAKAWRWLCNNIQTFNHPVVFWNIGA